MMAKKSMIAAIKHDRCFATSSRVEGTSSGEVTTQSRAAVAQCPGMAMSVSSTDISALCMADSNYDGIVGVDDLLWMLASYGRTTDFCPGVDGGR